MQARRFRADIERAGEGRIAILSTTWQTVSLMAPQDQGYRAFITELHRRMRVAGSKASLTGGIGTISYAIAVAMVALLAIAMVGLWSRALVTSEFTGALFLVGIAGWFVWTIGGFIKRNRPRRYSSTTSRDTAAVAASQSSETKCDFAKLAATRHFAAFLIKRVVVTTMRDRRPKPRLPRSTRGI